MKRILWIVNTIFPYPSSQMGYKTNVFGGWMNSLHNEMIKNGDIKLAIATVYKGKTLKRFFDGKTIYYLVPSKNNMKYEKKLEKYWQEVYNDFKPVIVHLHGTEFAHGLSFLRCFPNVKSVVSIQGIVTLCAKHYLDGIKKTDIIKNITLRDIIRHDNLFEQQKKYYKRGLNEVKILKRADIIIGRTSFDYNFVKENTDFSKYRKCNESLRDIFYNSIWDNKNIEKYSIFIPQASYPIKGLHRLIEQLAAVKSKFSDMKVYIAGANIIANSTLIERIKLSGYGKYLKSLIKKYNLFDNIIFVGLLNEEEIMGMLKKCSLFVQASTLENSSNSLGEAMIIGMPILASDVGGTKDIFSNKKDGFLFNYNNSSQISKIIIDIFSGKIDTCKMQSNARKHALNTHNIEDNKKTMLDIYDEIMEDL